MQYYFNYNPHLLNQSDLIAADQLTVLKAIYEVLVASTSLFFALIIFYFIFKACVWFLPKFWRLPSEKS